MTPRRRRMVLFFGLMTLTYEAAFWQAFYRNFTTVAILWIVGTVFAAAA